MEDVALGWVCGDLVHMRWAMCVIGARLPVIYAQGGPFLAQTRGALVSTFLGTREEDYLLMVDTDITFTNGDIQALRDHEADVVGGIYPISGDPAKLCAGYWDSGALIDAPPGITREVDYIGTGFLMVHRRVLEKIGSNWFDYMTVEKAPGRNVQIGEDLSFCHRIQDAGFSIILDTAVRLGHCKTEVLEP